MKILVISNTPWSDDNSFGNSFSNIFDGMDNLEFANIYLRPGSPHNQFQMQYFQITEKSLLRNLVNKSFPSGKRIYEDKETRNIAGYEFSRKIRLQCMFWARDLIWKLGHWKSEHLINFLDEFQPEIMFQPIYYSNYINEIVLFCKGYLNVPMLGYISDDHYTLKQFNLSPLYWIDRLHKRKIIKKVIERCEILYVISRVQKEEYERFFDLPCRVLTKCETFQHEVTDLIPQGEIRINYAGGIGQRRWNSLAMVSDAIFLLNNEGYKLRFDIYTSTGLTARMKKRLCKPGTILHSAVPYEEIRQIQESADILVHAEGLDKKSQYLVHQSFSTKLVDYFKMGKCILAIGTDDMASIRHLLDNNAALVAHCKQEVYQKLKELAEHPEMIADYGRAGYECGKRNHEKEKMQHMLVRDLETAYKSDAHEKPQIVTSK